MSKITEHNSPENTTRVHTYENHTGRYSIEKLIELQRPWSLSTFGEGDRTIPITAHILTELLEIREAHEIKQDKEEVLKELIDVILLAIDGCHRLDFTPGYIAKRIFSKQQRNFERFKDVTEQQRNTAGPIQSDTSRPRWNPEVDSSWRVLDIMKKIAETTIEAVTI